MRKFEVGPVGSGVCIKDVMQLEEIRKANKSAAEPLFAPLSLPSLLPLSSRPTLTAPSPHPRRTLAAPSPRPRAAPRCRRVHLTSLAAAAGVELEEILFFDNERGNCLVRTHTYTYVHTRMQPCSHVAWHVPRARIHIYICTHAAMQPCRAATSHTLHPHPTPLTPHPALTEQDVAELGVTVAFVPYGVTGEAWRRALESFPAPGEMLDNRRGL